MAEIESLHFSVGILGISGGSLLLLVNNYASSTQDFLPHTALGILLLVVAALLAYVGVCRSLSQSQLFSNLCLTVSALWFGSGLIYILSGEGFLQETDGLRYALIPGLAAFTLALLILGVVAILQRNIFLFTISLSISMACAHQIAGLSDSHFGQGATASNYLLVCLVGLYFGIGRLLSNITCCKVELPGTGLKNKSGLRLGSLTPAHNDLISVGLVMNLLSASVLACPLLGIVPHLFSGHVPWLWTAGVFQTGVCILSYRTKDPLTATFFGFTAMLKFAEGYTALLTAFSLKPSSSIPFPIVFSVLFFILAVFSCQMSLTVGLYQLFFVPYCISIATHSQGFHYRGTQGVQGAIFVVSTIMLFISLYNHGSPTSKIPTGEGLFQSLVTRVSSLTLKPHDKHLHAPYLGTSKYADAEVLGYGCSVLASFAVTTSVGVAGPLSVLILPWVVVAGGLMQLLCGSVAFSRGKTLESTAFILYGVMWSIWGLTRYGGLYGDTRGLSLAVGVIGFILFNCLVIVGTLFLNVAWFAYALTFQLILISFLLDALGVLPYGYDIAVTIIFGLVSFYCFLAHIFNSTFQIPQIPLGEPIMKLRGVGGARHICPHVPARKALSVLQIAEIMMNGGICGMPTDTVYVLVAACNRPEAVQKAFRVKKQAQDRPMSMWVSSIQQLEPVRHLLSPLLWDFMQAAWPSSISLVIPRGQWMDNFGLGEAAKHIGTPQSIAIRNPDCAVATHLMSLVGPIAVTSANPTGEADTTHHNQVYAKLGDKVDGVLCDGPSPENIASTVVDCTKIESGHIGFFRVGLIPKSKVLQIFENVQRRHMHGHINTAFEEDLAYPGRQTDLGEDFSSASSSDSSLPS
ncbi:uncharacterized protein si:ch211-153b23.4 [Osmerus mordax]|uniref:uncharacterized protein si:ch211-153b23.4 n=1 Tax=Osmerus mordax TaxID=8014 RepID=UPI00350F8BD1